MSFVSCSFELKDKSETIPLSVMTVLVETQYLLSSVECGYVFSCWETGFSLTLWQSYMPLDENLEELLEQDKLGYRHLRAFFWVKRHMRYEGESHNHNDWDRHPDDFFEYVEEVIRWFFKKKRGENVK